MLFLWFYCLLFLYSYFFIFHLYFIFISLYFTALHCLTILAMNILSPPNHVTSNPHDIVTDYEDPTPLCLRIVKSLTHLAQANDSDYRLLIRTGADHPARDLYEKASLTIERERARSECGRTFVSPAEGACTDCPARKYQHVAREIQQLLEKDIGVANAIPQAAE